MPCGRTLSIPTLESEDEAEATRQWNASYISAFGILPNDSPFVAGFAMLGVKCCSAVSRTLPFELHRVAAAEIANYLLIS